MNAAEKRLEKIKKNLSTGERVKLHIYDNFMIIDKYTSCLFKIFDDVLYVAGRNNHYYAVEDYELLPTNRPVARPGIRRIEMKGYEENREQRRTHAKYVYCKLCRNGELEAAQRVLLLLTNGSLPFFNGDADWKASVELTREKCIPSRVNAKGTSETFWI